MGSPGYNDFGFGWGDNVIYGENTIISKNVWIDELGTITIGHDSYIGGMVRIYRHHHDEDKYLWVREMENHIVYEDLDIGDHVFIGFRVLILPQCKKIGSGAVIGARSVVTHNIGKNEIWAGNPARLIRIRKPKIYKPEEQK